MLQIYSYRSTILGVMGSPELAVAVGKKQFIGSTEIEAHQQAPKAPPKENFGEVAKSEANHLTVGHALGIGASFAHAGRDSGYVIPDRYHPTMASAHRKGASHDRALVSAMGDNHDHHAPIAETIIEENVDTRNALAGALQREGSMGRARILSVINESRREQQERAIPRATLFVKTPDGGRTEVKDVKVEGGTVALPKNVVSLTTESQKKSPNSETAEHSNGYEVTNHRQWSRSYEASANTAGDQYAEIQTTESTDSVSVAEEVVRAEFERIQAEDRAAAEQKLVSVRAELALAA